MKTSIIIITYNGSLRIPRLLKSLSLLDENVFEVIIVNDGSTDNTVENIKQLKLPFPYTILSQDNMGRAASKNNGAKRAVNELLWFIDDDMRMAPGALTAHLMHHSRLPDSISVGTQIEDAALMKSDIQQYKCAISNVWKKQIETAANPLSADDLYMTSANVSMTREVFDRLGGFDKRLLDAEDLDLVYRALMAGVQVYYNPAALGYHLDLITCKSYIKRNRQYMTGYGILRELKPHYLEINKRMHLSTVTPGKKFILSVISRPFFVWLIDHFNIFRLILPVRMRYRFYELLIFGLGRVFPDRKI